MSEAEILYNKPVTSTHRVMGLKWKCPPVRPGQFVMLKPNKDYDPLLRRPFAVYSVLGGRKKTLSGTGIEILYKVVGKGTGIMDGLTRGEKVDLLAPLGNGFSPPDRNKKLVLVAGGIGIASFKLLALLNPGAVLLYGARGKSEVALAKALKVPGLKIKIATEDGSVGRRGLVTDLLKDETTHNTVVYACGPTGMLKAVAGVASEQELSCFVSLERSMACGVGACLGCAVKTLNASAERAGGACGCGGGGLKMVCSDGPVFDSSCIDWENI
ncbi:MAG: dihydroorotate dehydrogenase electron transfer subunit [Thermodesulfobacteriota bacterium]